MWHYTYVLLCTVLQAQAAATPAVQQSISYPLGPQQQTPPYTAAVSNGTDRWTLYHYTDPALHTTRAVPIMNRVRDHTEL